MIVLKNRNVALCIILSFITCGIYQIYWLYNLIRDTRVLGAPAIVESNGLMTLLCCTPFVYYWYYVAGKAFDDRGGSSLGNNTAMLFLVFGLLGFGIVNYAVMQSEINKAAGNYPN